MTDEEFYDIFRRLGMSNRRKVVESLLTGNDVQCFTTQQYAEAYHRICHRSDDITAQDGRWVQWLTEIAPKHLKSVGMREIKPDLWAPEAQL